MKKLLVLVAIMAISMNANAQKFSKIDKSVLDAVYYPDGAPKRTFEKNATKKMAAEPKIRILYSRPMKKGRDVFGELLKKGKAWRIGANESTEVLFMTDVMIGATQVKAGRYSMIAFPNGKEWTVKFNTGLDGWGNYSYDASLDVASITVPTATSEKEIEALSIVMYKASKNVVHIKIGWDKTIAEIPVTLK